MTTSEIVTPKYFMMRRAMMITIIIWRNPPSFVSLFFIFIFYHQALNKAIYFLNILATVPGK